MYDIRYSRSKSTRFVFLEFFFFFKQLVNYVGWGEKMRRSDVRNSCVRRNYRRVIYGGGRI